MTGIDARVTALEARAAQVADTATQHAGARERLAEMLRGMRERAQATMTDEEREIVREHLRWRIDLAARSEGEGPERHVVVIPI